MYTGKVEAKLEAKDTAAFLRHIGMSERDVRLGVKANEEERYKVKEHEIYKRKVEKATEKLKRYNHNIQRNNEAFESFMTEFNQLKVTGKPTREKINKLDELNNAMIELGI